MRARAVKAWHVFSMTLMLSACDDGHLRGSVKKSEDGKTYLRIVEGNGCTQLNIDGKAWEHAFGKAAEVSPGSHTIDCNGEIKFDIPQGVEFSFDYWGP